MLRAALGLALFVALIGVTGVREASAGTYLLVDTTSDDLLTSGCQDHVPDGDCSLRGAITVSNSIPALKAIIFNTGTGVPTIVLQSALPALTQPVLMDGATGGADAINIYGTNVQTDGLALQNHTGSTITHMVIDQFNSGAGISITGGGSHKILGNKIGIGTNGAQAIPNLNGIFLQNTTDNTIGGDESNIISGNTVAGVRLDSGANNNTVEGNTIGLNPGWATAVPNGDGVSIIGSGNQIGTSGHPNVISGNNSHGVIINGTSNQVQFNIIGSNPGGEARPNKAGGILIASNNGSSNTIGGSSSAGNLISGNDVAGIIIQSPSNVEVSGNNIGLDATGDGILPNQGDGIRVIQNQGFASLGATPAGGNGIAIGRPGLGNTVSGNTGSGIVIDHASGVAVQANNIGTDAAQTTGFGNGNFGVLIDGGGGNTIGGFATGDARNFIAANADDGIFINGVGGGGDNNQIINNWIGGVPDISGNLNGIEVTASSNTIQRNTIVSNMLTGIHIHGNSNVIEGNFIGQSGPTPMGNGADGILVEGANNRIGPAPLNPNGGGAVPKGGPEVTNVIWNNGGAGVLIGEGIGNTISQVSMKDNIGGGIDLAPENRTPNDTDDPDTGANNLQNYPVLTSASTASSAGGAVIQGGGSVVKGSLNSNPNTDFVLEFYSSNACNVGLLPGTGEDFIGSTTVHTNGGGDVEFSAQLLGTLTTGEQITATATHDNGSTSEFSECVQAAGATPTPSGSATPTPSSTANDVPGDADCDGDVDVDDALAVLREVADVPPGAPCAGNVGCEIPIDAQDALDIMKFAASPTDFPLPAC